MELMFDPRGKISYGYLSCKKCGSEYQIRCKPIHKSDCTAIGNENGDLVYHYSLREAELVMKDPHGRSPLGMLRRSDLEAHFDELPLEVQDIIINLRKS